MPGFAAHDDADSPALEAFLLGRVGFEPCLELQRRLAERRGRVRMGTVRSALVPHLAETLRCGRYHLHSGHRYLRDARLRAANPPP